MQHRWGVDLFNVRDAAICWGLSMWLPWLRWCRISENKVSVSPPVLFGRSYVFNRSRQIVTITRRVFGIPVSKLDVQFGDIVSVGVRETLESVNVGMAGQPQLLPRYSLAMRVADYNERFEIARYDPFWLIVSTTKARRWSDRIESAIREITGRR